MKCKTESDSPRSRQRVVARRGHLVAIVTGMLLAMSIVPSLAVGDGVWLKTGEVHFGIIVSRTGDEVAIQVDDEIDGGVQRFDLSDVALVVRNIDNDRLEGFSRARLEDYRDYAEELQTQRRDWAARGLSLRLYLIVAYHDSSEAGALREMALRALPALGRSEIERQQLAVLRSIHGVGGGKTKAESAERLTAESLTPESRSALRIAVQSIRRGKMASARVLLQSDEVRAVAAWAKDYCSLAELEQMTELKRIEGGQMLRVLRLERALSDRGEPVARVEESSWATQSQLPLGVWGKIPSLRNVTEFDPAKSRFQGGDWVPEED